MRLQPIENTGVVAKITVLTPKYPIFQRSNPLNSLSGTLTASETTWIHSLSPLAVIVGETHESSTKNKEPPYLTASEAKLGLKPVESVNSVAVKKLDPEKRIESLTASGF